jgi:hypothetical protein
VFASAGLGPELVPIREGENTVDLALRLSVTNLIEVEAKTPRPLQLPAEEPFDLPKIPAPRETIKKALDEARDQFSRDGILTIAGDCWLGGIDAYARAAEELLAAPLPAEASDKARFLRSNLLGVLLASLGYELVPDIGGVRTRLFLRWVTNPAYAGPIVLTWRPDTDGRMGIRFRGLGADHADGHGEDDDDFARYEEDAAFNPARFRFVFGAEIRVQFEGLIGPGADTPRDKGPVPVWVLPESYRPSKRFDFDVAAESGFTVVTVLPDGRVLGDPTVAWVDLHGVEFPVGAAGRPFL